MFGLQLLSAKPFLSIIEPNNYEPSEALLLLKSLLIRFSLCDGIAEWKFQLFLTCICQVGLPFYMKAVNLAQEYFYSQ